MKIAIVGTTSWGTTLGIRLGLRGEEVRLWARTEHEAERLRDDRENKRLLPGFTFPSTLSVTASLKEAVGGAGLVIFAVPSSSLRSNVQTVRDSLQAGMILLSAVKGLERDTARRMSQVMAEELPAFLHRRICVLSGPNLSQEIARGLPATSVVAAGELGVAEEARSALMSPLFRVYVNSDVVGVELGGALKNIIALGVGMSDGLGYGDNAKAALMTRGLAEIARLGVAAGAHPLTFSGLAGLGDLVATCSSPLSRNHRVGMELARGRPLPQVLASLGHVAEGIDTTVAARRLAGELGVEMPIAQQMYRVLFEGLGVPEAVAELMARAPRHELAGLDGGSGGGLPTGIP
ncbi:MAG: NAD(P)H-dependent glycerol-3-phosphate dehydrogenase [Chloroflexota bacterium]|nr:NAD(P)H-dependent glycerol-3-phosphate dehydrogenase [Chloroflexota bacterium]